jgi:O-antigen/teichoic acid export membrane protein
MTTAKRDRVSDQGQANRAAVSGTTLYALALGFDLAAQLVLFVYLSRVFPVETFGRYALISVAGAVLIVVTDMGCGAALVRGLADEGHPVRRAQLIATAWWGRAAFALAAAAAVMALYLGQPEWLSAEVYRALPAAAAALVASCLFGVAQDALRGQQRHLRPALAQVLRATVRTGLAFGLVGVAGEAQAGSFSGLSALLWAVAAGSGAAVLVCLPPLVRVGRAMPSVRLLRELLAYGVPVGAYHALRSASALDRYLVAHGLGVGAAGVYHVASMPCLGIEVLELAGALALEPYVYRVSRADPEAMTALFRRTVLVVAGLAMLLGVAAPEILAVLAPERYAATVGAMPLLVFAAACRASARLLAIAAGHLRRTRIFALTGAVDLAASLLLLPIGMTWFGLEGASWARFLPALLSLVACAALVRPLWPVPLQATRAVLYLAGAALAAHWLAGYASDPFAAAGLRISATAAILLVGWCLLWRSSPVR